MIMMDYATYRKKLRGCFVGKTIGGTLGMPTEGYLGTKTFTYYDPVPTGMVANDDLDLQVIWLEVIRRCGLPVNRRDLADGWLEHMRGLPDEYGVAIKNLESGIYPPFSGYYDNKFNAGMGSAIRTEIWAALAPGDPDLAVRLAREDACVDHYGEGVEASVFLAAVESAAYVHSDYLELIQIGLSYLDPNGRMAHAFNDVVRWWEEYHDVLQVRELIIKHYFSQNWTNVTINLSLILLSWLSSEGDCDKAICTAAGLGYDTDCTAATLGAIMGILHPDGFDEKWLRPLGDDLILSSCISNMHETNTISGLCDQIADVCVEALVYYGSNTQFVDPPALVGDRATPWAPSERTVGLKQRYARNESLISVRPFTIRLFYPENLAVAPGKTEAFTAKISNPQHGDTPITVQLKVPDGWLVEPGTFELALKDGMEQEITFAVTAPIRNRRSARNPIDFHITCGNVRTVTSAALIPSIDFLRLPAADADITDPMAISYSDAKLVSAPGHIQKVPEGSWIYATEVRGNKYFPKVIFVGQGTRAMKVWLDDELILDHDGSEYIPAYHRSDYVAHTSMSGGWKRLTVLVSERGTSREVERSPKAAIVPVEGNPTTYELRQKYDAEALYQGEEDAELFLGFASMSGYQWLSELEWRLPQDKK